MILFISDLHLQADRPALTDAFLRFVDTRARNARQLYLLSEETRSRASEIQVPLLVMHGGADPITDPDGSREFVANASSADKELVIWPDDLHEIFNELDQEAVIKRMIDWLNARFPRPATDTGPQT